MKKLLLLSIVCFWLAVCPNSIVKAQGIGINSSGNPPDQSAILDASSTTKGLLIPRMTTSERDSVISPAEGLQIINTTTKCLQIYLAGSWQSIYCSCTAPASPSAATHIATSAQVQWTWNTVSGATGYKYNTVNNYSSATDNGNNTTYTQTGLSCATSYTLYVWAYNGSCFSSPTTLTKSTSSCCVEGTGGTITHVGGNTIHTFTSTGTFTPGCAMNVRVLVVAGGGGGGSGGGGGGGGGGYIEDASYPVSVQNYTVTVGAGGAGGTGYVSGNNGSNSVFGTHTAIGGGAGAGSNDGNGFAGGSGGGGAQGNTTGGAGTPGQGNAGGSCTNYAYPYAGTGGGGAGAAGGNTVIASVSGSGGDGLSSNISGSTVFYAGGGGGSTFYGPGTGGAGGNGGGGAGCGGENCVGSSAIANTGGGGGGGGGIGGGVAGNGGSGIVIISYPTP